MTLQMLMNASIIRVLREPAKTLWAVISSYHDKLLVFAPDGRSFNELFSQMSVSEGIQLGQWTVRIGGSVYSESMRTERRLRRETGRFSVVRAIDSSSYQ